MRSVVFWIMGWPDFSIETVQNFHCFTFFYITNMCLVYSFAVIQFCEYKAPRNMQKLIPSKYKVFYSSIV